MRAQDSVPSDGSARPASVRVIQFPAWALDMPKLGVSKFALMALWSKAPVSAMTRDSVVVSFKPRPNMSPADTIAEELAEMTGSTAPAVRKHLYKLRKRRLIKTSGHAVTLFAPEVGS